MSELDLHLVVQFFISKHGGNEELAAAIEKEWEDNPIKSYFKPLPRIARRPENEYYSQLQTEYIKKNYGRVKPKDMAELMSRTPKSLYRKLIYMRKRGQITRVKYE